MKTEFDLTPDPRVLEVLGDISLDQWKCIAELVDNAIDGFKSSGGLDDSSNEPEVVITIPTSDSEGAHVSVADNGPGMDEDSLEKAVKAGWSGNNPYGSLGLFGMGFNIATARLGLITEIYSTRIGDPEWIGLRIDLEELRRNHAYHTPRLTKPKADPSKHGTEICIKRLKRDQRRYFSRGANIRKLRTQLSHIYAPLLDSSDSRFRLQINGQLLQAHRPCHWDPERSTHGADGRPVHAVETFDVSLAPRRYCTNCGLMLNPDEVACPTCKSATISELRRRLHGWIGLQRYMHEDDYGIDLIRNGRVIESKNKDLFFWVAEDRREQEYPIDDPRNRGRFIGQIHMDHCRVHYTKDRFERDDPAWLEMVHTVRGEGPMLPVKRKNLGFPPSNAPLYRLFQAFRRSSPQGKAGRWERIIVVKDNDRAREMAESFHKGDPDYQSDEKWWELVLEQDRSVVGVQPDPDSPTGTPPDLPEGFLDTGDDKDDGKDRQGGDESSNPTPEPAREKLHGLSRTYTHSLLKVEFPVEAFSVMPNDPDLPVGAPWGFKLDDPATRSYQFLVQRDHPIFRSITMTPLDALLSEIALSTYEFLKDQRPSDAIFSAILSDLRSSYSRQSQLDSQDLIASADATFKLISESIATTLSKQDSDKAFQGLPEKAKDNIRRKAALSGATKLTSIIAEAQFLRFAEPEDIRDFVISNPELFFDGKFWNQSYAALDFDDESTTELAREHLIEQFSNYLTDAVWLASQTPADIDSAPREVLIRAAQSLRLLAPDMEV